MDCRFTLVIFLISIGFSNIEAQEDELLSVAVVFRHGDRTPLSTYPNDPYNNILFKDDDSGQLTNVGKNRHYELGKWLRNRYDEFLTDKYDHNNVAVVSDDSDRCLMSAASNLAGLYPPQEKQVWNENLLWQPIPIRLDSHLLSGEPVNCPAYDKEKSKVLVSDWAKNLNLEHQELFEYVSNNTGRSISNFEELESIRDILYIEDTLNLTLPSWTDSIYPELLDDLAGLKFGLITNTTTLAKFSVGRIFNDIIDKFVNSKKKLYMYSAHDSNIGPIMYTLRPSEKRFCPYFASTVIFEYWGRGEDKIIKVIFNNHDKIEDVEIEGCGVECALEDFQELFREFLIDQNEWQAQCDQ